MSELSPERRKELEGVLAQPKRPAKEMTSLERLLRVQLYQEMMRSGIEVPEDHLSYAVELITVDRTEKASVAKEEKKKAKAAGSVPTAADL